MKEDKIRQKARQLINEKYPYLPFGQWGYFEDMFINGWKQALTIPAVVGRSEQLLAFKEWERDKCRLSWDAEPKDIVEQYLSQ